MANFLTYYQKKAVQFNLFQSIMKGNIGAVQLLISRGADVNKANNLDWTPLQAAVLHENKTIVKLLLNSGANVNAKDTSQKTKFQRDIRRTAFFEELFLAEVTQDLDTSMSPVHLSVLKDNHDITMVLLKAGPDLSARDNAGRTAFDYALDKYNYEYVKIFIMSGLNIYSDYYWEQKVLMEAVDKVDHQVIEYLLRRGTDLNGANAEEKLRLALAMCDFKLMEFLKARTFQ